MKTLLTLGIYIGDRSLEIRVLLLQGLTDLLGQPTKPELPDLLGVAP